MPSPVFRLWVLVLAVLLQVGSWHTQATSTPNSVAVPLPALGDFDTPEDSSEELSAVDDAGGTEVVAASVPNWGMPPSSSRWNSWAAGLAPGIRPVDEPFKPPRA